MQRLVMVLLPMLSLLGSGCIWKKQAYYTYCDRTGCYTCGLNGCTPQ